MVRSAAFAVAMALLLAGCSSALSTEPTIEPGPTQTAPVQPQPTSNIVVSDAVPTLQELMDMGVPESSAECFIDTIDPDGTGRVENADLFMQAFGACL